MRRVAVPPRGKFHAFEGLRGVAAIAVVMRHANPGLRFDLPSAHLAVDLFFVLSGFVLAHAYDGRLQGGMGASEFMRLRLVRLYPLYLTGCLIALFTAVAIHIAGSPNGWTPSALWTVSIANALFLPAFVEGHPDIFPLDTPAWSLFFELLANLIWVLCWRWLSTRVLIWVTAVAALGVAGAAAAYGTLDIGWSGSTFPGGLARVAFAFPLGVLLYRLTRDWRPIRLSPWVIMAAAVLMFRGFRGPYQGLYEVGAVLFIVPALVVLASLAKPSPRSVPVLGWLGTISYPIYVLHLPLLGLAYWGFKQISGEDVSHLWIGCACVVALFPLSWAADRWFDVPLRRWLLRVSKRPTRSAAVAL